MLNMFQPRFEAVLRVLRTQKEKMTVGNWSELFSFSRQRRIWSFHVVVLQRTAGKCTKNNNTHCFSHETFCLVTFSLSLPSSFANLCTAAPPKEFLFDFFEGRGGCTQARF